MANYVDKRNSDDDEKSYGRKGNKKTSRTNRKRGNNSRSSRNSSSSRDSRIGNSTSDSGCNDVAWYSNNPALLRDAATMNFTLPMGSNMDMNFIERSWNGKESLTENVSDYKLPGICSLNVVPSFGKVENPTDPLNVAATAVYSFIRHANAGHANYDAPDLMMYIVSMASVYSYINYLQRVYATSMLFAGQNKYLPKALLHTMHVDAEDLRFNLANFRYGMNLLIEQAAALAVPAGMPIFQRMAFMYQNIYTEGESIKDQLYLYNPDGFLQYEWKETGSSGVKYVPFANKDHTTQELLDYGFNLLNAVLPSEDMGIMSGDILKAYGINGIIKLATVPEYIPFAPVYNQLVLEQMHNATIMECAYLNNEAIKQDDTKAYLVSTLKTAGLTGSDGAMRTPVGEYWMMNKIMSCPVSDPGPDYVIEASRLMCAIPRTGTSGEWPKGTSYPIACGSEIIKSVTFVLDPIPTDGTYSEVTTNGYVLLWSNTATLGDSSTLTVDEMKLPYAISAFKYHPAVIMMRVGSDSSGNTRSLEFTGHMFGVDNFNVMNYNEIRKLHEAALLSLFAVPSIGKTTTVLAK